MLDEQIKQLQEMYAPEELVPELQKYVREGSFGPMIQHPLVFSVPHSPQMNKMMNLRLHQKQQAVAKAVADRNFSSVIWLHEKPYRVPAFMEISLRLSDQEYWSILGDIYTNIENVWQYQTELLTLLTNKKRNGRSVYLMDRSDRKSFKALAKSFTIYRGANEFNKLGLSWTLDRDRAIWFSRRFGFKGQSFLMTATVNHRDVIAYFAGRGEQEIVVDPRRLTALKEEMVEAYPS